ncbi:MAG: transcriptional repressor [Tepidiformaceae bacterium]
MPIPADTIRHLLERHGLRPSAKRFAILTILANAGEWMTCEDVAMSISREWPTTERASISQSLCQLADAAVVESRPDGEKRQYRLVSEEQ